MSNISNSSHLFLTAHHCIDWWAFKNIFEWKILALMTAAICIMLYLLIKNRTINLKLQIILGVVLALLLIILDTNLVFELNPQIYLVSRYDY